MRLHAGTGGRRSLGSERRDARPAWRRKRHAGGAPGAEARAAADLDRRHPARGGAGGDGRSARVARAAMDAGRLVSDDVMIGIVAGAARPPGRPRSGFVLDGFPRTVEQASALDRMVNGRGPLVVLDVVVPEDVLVQRLATRRICATLRIERHGALDRRRARSAAARWWRASTTATRSCASVLKVYQRQSKPLVDYYSARGDAVLDRWQPAGRRRDGGGGRGRRVRRRPLEA